MRRILSRLRSRHANRTRKTVGKQAIIVQLNQAINDKSVKGRAGIAECRWVAARDGARALLALFTRLEKIIDPQMERVEVQKVLVEIVKTAYEFIRKMDLSAILQKFSGDPSLKRHLPEAIGKLARYYSSASDLLCAARDRKCRVFRHIEVEPFEIPMPAGIQEASEKVHAEIQLLFSYELNPDRPKPRLICSSKSACYLCNLFFRFHKAFDVPRTHGRLYEKWTLPDWLAVPNEQQQDLGIILTRLIETLEHETKAAMRSAKKYLHPNESVLLPPAHWSSSSSAVSRSRSSTVPASISRIPPHSSMIQEEEVHSGLSPREKIPSSQPKTSLELPNNPQLSNSDEEHIGAPTVVSLVDSCRNNVSALDVVFLVTVQNSDLPYCQSITATTPVLQVQLNMLSLMVKFIQVFSGQLLISHAEDAASRSGEYQVVNIKDIPTTAELQLQCLDNSNKLLIQLQNDRTGLLCFTFVWGVGGPIQC